MQWPEHFSGNIFQQAKLWKTNEDICNKLFFNFQDICICNKKSISILEFCVLLVQLSCCGNVVTNDGKLTKESRTAASLKSEC